ncbi:MAG: sensor histidine kinase, partial [Myxococcota bacterium]
IVAFKLLELEVLRQRMASARQVVAALHHEVTVQARARGLAEAEPGPEVQHITDQFLRAGNLESIFLFDASGRLIAHPESVDAPDPANDPLVRRAIESGAAVTTLGEGGSRLPGYLTSLKVGERVRIAVPLGAHPGAQAIGVAVVPLGDVRHSVAQSYKVLAAFIVFDAFIMVVFGSWFLSRALVRPLDRLVRAAGAVARGDLSQKVVTDKPNEIGALGSAFNLMTDRLRESRKHIQEQIAHLEAANADLARAQADLVRSEKLASVGRLAAGIAHEVGNPLSSILGLTDVLARGGEAGFSLPPEAREHTAQIRKETERIHRIIRRLLDFSRPSRPDIRDADVNETIRETLALATPMADLRQADVRLDLDPALPTAKTDPSLLQQVLMNLIVNAGQAMPDGGVLRISSRSARFGMADGLAARRAGDPPDSYFAERRIGARTRAGEPAVEITVSDTGEGIPPGLLPQIFDPFVTTKDPGRGTGLGLSVVHSIVEMLEGNIRVASDSGKGAVFTLTLPVARRDP